jgi:methionyl-tRNA formyltransferase
MRIIFFGTPQFAVPSLEALLAAGHDVVAVVTQPDRTRDVGPDRQPGPPILPPVKTRALSAGIRVLQPERPRGEDFLAELRAFKADIGVVVAYGHVLRPDLLALLPLGFVNVHASLLPRWRGAAPIHWAVLRGDTETGVAIMRLEQGLDTGAVWLQRRTPILPTDTTGILFERLADLGAKALVEALPRIADGELPRPQATEGITHAPKIDRATARIRWDAEAQAVADQIRAMDPAPGAWTTLHGADLKLFGGTPQRSDSHQPSPSGDGVSPGSLHFLADGPAVACGDGWLLLGDVQAAGRRRMTATAWANGLPTRDGLRLT